MKKKKLIMSIKITLILSLKYQISEYLQLKVTKIKLLEGVVGLKYK